MAVLVERTADGTMDRMDFSEEAWDAGRRPDAGCKVFGSWRSMYQPGQAKRPSLVSDEELLDLFSETAEATEPRQLAFRYLLALILIRRRLLRCIESKAGSMLVLPRGASAGDPGAAVRVIDPGLDDTLIADAIEQVAKVVPGDETTEGGS